MALALQADPQLKYCMPDTAFVGDQCLYSARQPEWGGELVAGGGKGV